MSFYRKPSPLEVLYAGTDCEESSPYVINLIIEGEGCYNLEQWQEAAAKTSSANPGTCLVLKGKWGFKYWDTNGPGIKVSEFYSDWDGVSSEGAYLGEPINCSKGPNTQILLNPGKGRFRAIFRIHHAIADGQGAVHWVKDFFRALRNEPLLGSTGTYNEWDLVKKFPIQPKKNILGQCIVPTQAAKNPDLQGMRWRRLTFPGPQIAIVPKLMIAISNIAREQNGGKGKTAFRIPSDLRYLARGKAFSMANMTGAIDIEVQTAATVHSLSKAIKRSLLRKENLAVFPKHLYLLKWLPTQWLRIRPEVARKRHANIDYQMTANISHVGDMKDLSEFSCSQFKPSSFYCPPIPLEERAVSIVLTTNTCNGLDAVIGVPHALASVSELIDLCDKIKTELHAFNVETVLSPNQAEVV